MNGSASVIGWPVIIPLFIGWALLTQAQPLRAAPVSVQWLGHACFLIEGAGKRVLIDPIPPKLGYPSDPVSADVVLVSHDHFDHCYVKLAQGTPPVIRGTGSHQAAGLTFVGVPAKHWELPKDRARGDVVIFCWEQAGVRFCHLSDLGRDLNPEQTKAIGLVDVLFVPVGGFFTIGPEQAVRAAQALKPKIVVPMHYRTPVLMADLAAKLQPVEDFLAVIPEDWQAVRLPAARSEVSSLPAATQVWVFAVPSQ